MKEDFEKIGKDLFEWCKKYEKDYVNLSVLKNHVMGNVSPEDIDYKECKISIFYKEEEE